MNCKSQHAIQSVFCATLTMYHNKRTYKRRSSYLLRNISFLKANYYLFSAKAYMKDSHLYLSHHPRSNTMFRFADLRRARLGFKMTIIK